ARRETVELLRDPIRLAFAVFGPIILMLAFGYGISFDIENVQMAAFDQDNTPESRQLLDGFKGSRYFSVQEPIEYAAQADRRLRSGNTQIVVEVPSGFGRDLLRGGVFMLMLCLIPAIMTAIAVVREKETGSIANFRSTPITKFEFLLG